MDAATDGEKTTMTTIHAELDDAGWTTEQLEALAREIDTGASYPRVRGESADADNRARDVERARFNLHVSRDDAKAMAGRPSAARWARTAKLAEIAFVNALRSAGIPTV